MSGILLVREATRCAEEIGLNEYMRSITSAVWTAFEHSLPGSTCPAQLEDIDVQLVERFIASRACLWASASRSESPSDGLDTDPPPPSGYINSR